MFFKTIVLYALTDYLKEIDLKEWIGIAAFFISLVNLYRSIREKKINIDATMEIGYKEVDIIIYNNSSRKIIVTFFEVYAAQSKWLSKRHYFHTWYDEGSSPKYIIDPFEYRQIRFDEEYHITPKGRNIYFKVTISGSSPKTIRLR